MADNMPVRAWNYLDEDHDSPLPREMEEVECEVGGNRYRAFYMDGMFIAAIGEVFQYEEVSRWRTMGEV